MLDKVTKACDHDENRKKVCATCGKKIVVGKLKIDYFKITSTHEDLIKKFVNINYNKSDLAFPSSICSTCRQTLTEHDKNILKRPMPIMPQYKNYISRIPTRQSKSENADCQCDICITARQTVHKKVQVGRGKMRSFSDTNHDSRKIIDQNNSKSLDGTKIKTTLNICSVCLQKTGKGKNHNCSDRYHSDCVRQNALKIIDNLPQKEQERIAVKIIHNKIKNSSNDVKKKSSEILLSTSGGLPTKITLDNKPKKVEYQVQSLDNLQLQTASSYRQMKKITSFIRSASGNRHSIPKNYRQHMTQKTNELKDFYYISEFKFEICKESTKKNRTAVWANAEEILEYVLEKRQVVGNYIVKVMADGGQHFFKISMSIIPENYYTDDDTEYSPKIKRMRYSKENNLDNLAKLTSVHRTIMICIVPDVKETYDNIKLLFDVTKINDISCKFVSDFKLILTVNGMQTASSSFPCPYCFVRLDYLRSRKDLEESDNSYSQSRTFGSIENDYKKYCNIYSKDKKKAKMCHSVVNPPLFCEDKNKQIIEKFIVPELHLMQGFVNHLFWDGLVPLLGREKALLWPEKLNIISKSYHGDTFEGNACRKLLKNSDSLLDLENNEVGKLSLVPYVSAFKAMDKLVQACFSSSCVNTKELDKILIDLRKMFLATGVSESLKIHVILKHIKESLQFLPENDGLGLFSEQAGESIHREFLKYWNKYKMNNIHDPSYGTRLKKAVTEFSSKHI